jgi:hypothetical protein
MIGISKYHQFSPTMQDRILKFLEPLIPKNFDNSHEKWNVWTCDEDSATNFGWNPMRAHCCYEVYQGNFSFATMCNTFKVSTPVKKIMNSLLNSIYDQFVTKNETSDEEEKKTPPGSHTTTLTLKINKFNKVTVENLANIHAFLSPFIPDNFGPKHELWNVWDGEDEWTPMRAFICKQFFFNKPRSLDAVLTIYELDPNVYKKRITGSLNDLYKEFVKTNNTAYDQSSIASPSAMTVLVNTAATVLQRKEPISVVPDQLKPRVRKTPLAAMGFKKICLNNVKNVYSVHFLKPDTVRDFTCCDCKNVAIDPVACNKRECENIWCSVCIKETQNVQCANCNTPVANMAVSPLIRKVIDSKLIACPMGPYDKETPLKRRRNQDSAICGWTGTLGNLRQHIEDDCRLVVIHCMQCECAILRGDKSAHELECSGRAIPCQYCNKLVSPEDKHDCKQKCFYAGLGCDFDTHCAEELEKHEADSYVKHLRLLAVKVVGIGGTKVSPMTP